MLTTTPLRRPRDGCMPSPITFMPSSVTSATMATIFDVPMSSPTITFLPSFTMPRSRVSASSDAPVKVVRIARHVVRLAGFG
jgi:hypothetical protein